MTSAPGNGIARAAVVVIAIVLNMCSPALAWDELGDAIAEADRLDPGWRLAQLVEARAKDRPPDDQNAVVQARRALALLPDPWPREQDGDAENPDDPSGPALLERLDRAPSNAKYPEALVAALKRELDPVAPALAEARKLAAMPRGQTDFAPAKIVAATRLTYTGRAPQLARLLAFDVHARVAQGDHTGAVESTLALLNSARAIGDEPTTISQLVRIANDRRAVRALERVLAQVRADDAGLERLQAAFLEEAEAPRFLYGLRGERASLFDFFEKLATGQITKADLEGGENGSFGKPLAKMNLASQIFVRHNQALGLQMMTQAVEFAKNPYPEQHGWVDWEAPLLNQNFLQKRANAMISMLLPAVSTFGIADRRVQCLLRAGAAAVACERFRLARRRWPETLDALVPDYLSTVPIDPYNGNPLTLRRLADGLAVYGLGNDAEDNQGKFSPQDRDLPGHDTGVRLFDVDHRGAATIP